MKELFLFDQSIQFDMPSKFHLELKSPVTGSLVSASTPAGSPEMSIKVECPRGPKQIQKETILKIPLGGQPWKSLFDEDANRECIIVGDVGSLITIGGKKPKPKPPTEEVISIGGKKPKPKPKQVCIVIGGPYPKSLPGSVPTPSSDEPVSGKSEVLMINLEDPTKDWQIEPDMKADILNISIGGRRTGAA